MNSTIDKPKFHVTALGDYADVALSETVLFCVSSLRQLGYEVSHQNNHLVGDAINIIMAAQHTSWHEVCQQTQHAIIYNFDQVAPDVPWFTPQYFRQMVNAHVWDYNENNINKLRAAGVSHTSFVPLGYVPEMTRGLPQVEQDIDVLFYGIISERRKVILLALMDKGLRVVGTGVNGLGVVMGKERDELIARAKVIVNMHHYEQAKVFELPRVSYLLSNAKAVVSEVGSDTEIDDDIRQAIVCGEFDELVQLCADLVNDDVRRHALEQKAFEIFSKHNRLAHVKDAVDDYFRLRDTPRLNIAPPPILHLGAGDKWHYSYCSMDAAPDMAADWVLNIGQDLPFGQEVDSWRFGRTVLQKSYFHKIIAPYVFQRVDDLHKALTNCLELLVDGGIVELSVPLDLSYDAWMHIDDKRAFNDKTWGRIIDNWWQYGWDNHRFELISTGFGLHNEYGMQFLVEHNNDWGLAMREPRAIDVMHLTLRKRALTDDERAQLPRFRFTD